MPFKDREKYNAYMREYRKKISNKKKNSIESINKENKPIIRKPENIKNKITQEEKEFLKEIIRRMNRRRYIDDNTTKKALDILYK